MNLHSPLSKLAICCGSFLLFSLSFRLNGLLDSFALYAPGVNLVFVPAGIKLVCLLVGGEAAALGLLLSSVHASLSAWQDTSLLEMVSFAIASIGSYYLTLKLASRLMGIDQTLSNLRYWHIVILCVLVSLANGTIQNIVYLVQQKVLPQDLLASTAAMVLGDFLGCFIVISLINVGIDVVLALLHRSEPGQSGFHRVVAYLRR